MIRFIIRLLVLLLLAALGYGFYLLYQEKTAEEKTEVIETIQGAAVTAARSAAQALNKSGEKVKGLLDGEKEGEQE